MKRLPLVLVLALALLVGCGDSDGGNDAVVSAAEDTAAARTDAEAEVEAALDLEPYSGVERTFLVDGATKRGGSTTCSIDAIYAGSEVGSYSGEEILTAPDGSFAIGVGHFVDTELADCLSTAQATLGW